MIVSESMFIEKKDVEGAHNFSKAPSEIKVSLKFSATTRGGEWYLEKRGSWKILSGSQNLGSVYDKSRDFLPKSLGLGFLTKISTSPEFYHSPPLQLQSTSRMYDNSNIFSLIAYSGEGFF